jgi:hypothetical protein
MNLVIPQKFQIFSDAPVVLSDKDAERLAPYLRAWMGLASIIYSSNTEDLKRLIILELMGKRRQMMIERLISRLGNVQQEEWRKRIGVKLKKPTNKRGRPKHA